MKPARAAGDGCSYDSILARRAGHFDLAERLLHRPPKIRAMKNTAKLGECSGASAAHRSCERPEATSPDSANKRHRGSTPTAISAIAAPAAARAPELRAASNVMRNVKRGDKRRLARQRH